MPSMRVAVPACLLLAVAAYGGVSVLLYDGLSRIGDVCAQVADNRPDDFTCHSMCDGWETFNFGAYQMPEYESVSFPSRDGMRLSGWFVPADPGAPAVVVVHGYQVCKYHHDPLAQAGALHRAGFNVLLFDQRDCGDSEHEDGRTAYGSEEYLDALGAWDYLVERGFAESRIGLHGSSLGGAISLIAFAQEPRIRALFLDSPLTDGRAQFVEYTGLPGLFFPGIEWAAGWLSDDELMRFDPLDGMRLAGDRKICVVHGTADDIVLVSHTDRLRRTADASATLLDVWKPEGVGHVRALAAHPDAYEARLRTYFSAALGG